MPQAETKPYFAMAQQYVLADQMFASNFDGSSFISHQYIIAGQASSAVNYPYGYWGCDGGPSDTVEYDHAATRSTVRRSRRVSTIKRSATSWMHAGVSWRFYTSSVNGDGGHLERLSGDQPHPLRPRLDQRRHHAAVADFSTTCRTGSLPAVSWVTPTCAHSDHAGCDSNTGPAWVASLVNAIGESQYWNSTAIFVMWDDYGGWYDHVPPPLVDYDGLGIRVPLLIVSPYAKKGYVSHVQYEHGSILKFVEDVFGLPRLAASDARANSPAADCFKFARQPRIFQPIQASLKAEYFLHEAPDLRPPDTQ